jgi:hypothetical protein
MAIPTILTERITNQCSPEQMEVIQVHIKTSSSSSSNLGAKTPRRK